MAITFTTAVRIGAITLVTVTSSLTGTVYFHWYLDGAYVGFTTSGQHSFQLPEDGLARVEVVDTNDAAFDPLAAPPAFFPARFTIHWVRSLSTDVKEYLVEWSLNGVDNWSRLVRIPHDEEVWDYAILTERLVDLTNYFWRVQPVDVAGNIGTALLITGPIGEGFTEALIPVQVVRVPDAPRWAFTWNAGTQRVTYAAA